MVSENMVNIVEYSSNRPISQVPQCIDQISHNAPFCNINVHTKSCIVWCGTSVLWDLHNGSIRLLTLPVDEYNKNK